MADLRSKFNKWLDEPIIEVKHRTEGVVSWSLIGAGVGLIGGYYQSWILGVAIVMIVVGSIIYIKHV